MNLYDFTKDELGVELSPTQDALMAATAGVTLSAEQRDVFQERTKRLSVRMNAREWALICGARSGKTTRIMAPIAIHRAVHGAYSVERGVIHQVIGVAQDESGTEAMFTAVRDYVYSTPEVTRRVTAITADEIAFDTGVTIATFPSKAAVFRSRSIPVGLVDEYAHQGRRTREILTAIVPIDFSLPPALSPALHWETGVHTPRRLVYALQRESQPWRYYAGLMSNVRDRLQVHNEGRAPHTATGVPWRIVVAIEFADEARAIAFERYLKSGSGCAFAKRHLR